MYDACFIILDHTKKFKINMMEVTKPTIDECWDAVEEAYPDAEEITLKASYEFDLEKCTYCGRESDIAKTKNVQGYSILDICTDCEEQILKGDEEQ